MPFKDDHQTSSPQKDGQVVLQYQPSKDLDLAVGGPREKIPRAAPGEIQDIKENQQIWVVAKIIGALEIPQKHKVV